MLRNTILAAGAALAFALPLHAQTIRAGQTVNGELAAADPKLDDGSHYDLYTFRGRRGERVIFEMRSHAFDAWLSIGRVANGRYNEIRSDDDRAGGTDAHIAFAVRDDGEYVVRANSAYANGRGAYTLSAVAVAETPPPIIAGTLAAGRTVRGSLDAADPTLGDGTHFELWRFSGRAGQTVEVVMRSTALDSYLAVGRMRDRDLLSLETDDDAAGGTDARVRLTLPADGEYMVRANSQGRGATGDYTLSLAEAGPAAARASREIRVGQTVTGSLAEDDAVASDGSFFDAYVVEGNAGDRVRIRMASTDFDAYLAVGQQNGDRFNPLDNNDDGPEGTDAELRFTLPSAGRFVIRANTFAPGKTGAYTLSVTRP